jgi:hypothetical protein
LAVGAPGGCVLKPYPQVEDLLRPVLRVAMPRAPRLYAPGGTVHVVARCNNRDFYFTTSEDFELLLAHLREMVRTYEVTRYAYTLIPTTCTYCSRRLSWTPSAGRSAGS